MKRKKEKQKPYTHSPKQVSHKWLFILLRGGLGWGTLTAFVSSLLIELSYSPITEPEILLKNLSFRLAVCLPLFIAAGSGFGHWLWTYRVYAITMQNRNYFLKEPAAGSKV